VHLVKLKHPHYKISDWSGVWSNGSSNWDEITCSEIERIGLKHLQEGEFWYEGISDLIEILLCCSVKTND